MNISSNDLSKLKKFCVGDDTFNNGGKIYWYSDDVIYKIVGEYFFCGEVERNIDLQIREHIPNTPVIYDKLCNNDDFIGYSMEYLKNCFTFRKGSYLHIDFDVCVNVIRDIYEVIKYLHNKNILLGDIHMDNFLINNKGNGYVVDLDYLVYPEDKYKFQDLYCIRLKSVDNYIDVKRTDNIKAMICCLSLILGVDLESKCINRYIIDIEKLYNGYVKKLGIGALDEYFYRIMNGEEVEYFDEFMSNYYCQFLGSGKVKLKKK